MSSSTTVPDRGIETLGVIWSLTGASGIILVLRVYCKFSRHRGLWWDDYILILAWVWYLSLLIVCRFRTADASSTVEPSRADGRHDPRDQPRLRQTCRGHCAAEPWGAGLPRPAHGLLLDPGRPLEQDLVCHHYAAHHQRVGEIRGLGVHDLVQRLHADIGRVHLDVVHARLEDLVDGHAWSGIMDIFLALLPWTIIPKLQMRTREKFGVAVAMSMGVFAGITGFVKCWKLQALASGDFTWDGVDLVEWGAAETAVTVIATSIPILRALFSELRSTARSNSKGTGKDAMPASQSRFSRMSKTPAVVVNARARPVSQQELNEGDSDSDRSIWPGGKPYIMKTDEITLTYDERRRDEENGYEMDLRCDYLVSGIVEDLSINTLSNIITMNLMSKRANITYLEGSGLPFDGLGPSDNLAGPRFADGLS
ncbi:hypothetical protein BJ166DRAFT_574367 [Pestalotiopsis sp. NC0098]|nr:hypothetical protein BJ166DRAFT_574367 [Pestalotiopsis sp. NC0098]